MWYDKIMDTNIKRSLAGFVCILCVLSNPGISKATQDKFENSFDLKKNRPPSSVPLITQTIPLPANNNPGLDTPTMPPTITQEPMTPPSLPTIQPTAPLSSSPPIAPPMKNIADIKKLNITVPDSEKKYRELFEAGQIEKGKKRKSLIDSILDEFVRYGILITLGLVVFIVIYTIKKDKDITPQAPQSETPKEDEQKIEEKKDIWKESF